MCTQGQAQGYRLAGSRATWVGSTPLVLSGDPLDSRIQPVSQFTPYDLIYFWTQNSLKAICSKAGPDYALPGCLVPHLTDET